MNLKKRLGFKSKARPAEQLSRDYNHNAIMIGHKRRMQQDFYNEAERLETEITAHLAAMKRATLEAKHVPPSTKGAPAEAPSPSPSLSSAGPPSTEKESRQ